MPEIDQTREFTGIWIPRAIVEDEQLTWTERAVFAEIASFVECYATNEFLARRIGVTARWIQETVAKLKKLGYVKQTRFDGRRRYLQAYTMSRESEFIPAEQPRTSVPSSHEAEFTPATSDRSPIDNKREQSTDHIHPPAARADDGSANTNGATHVSSAKERAGEYYELVEHVRSIQSLPPWAAKSKQYQAAKHILGAGHSLAEAKRAAERMHADAYWAARPFDTAALARNIHRYTKDSAPAWVDVSHLMEDPS